MKKKLFIAVVCLVLGTGAVYAEHPSGLGIGVEGGWSSWIGGGLTLKFPSVPIFWTVHAYANPAGLGFELAGDKYLIDQDIASILGWYLGIGAYAGLGVWDNLALWGGLRVPIGLSLRPIDLLEIYLQVVPHLGVSILPEFFLPHGGWGTGWIGGSFGIRLWF
ncbi:MAG: hypothetical protein LBG74_04495 [Spirochaetaceae bacterium]|jgi:hypothetical protein|nr:hypothetical protein [Spirochaetaceae bacterium]